MAETVEFELVSPEHLVISEPVAMVVVPGGDGDFGVLPGHAPLISTLRPGVIAIYEDGKVRESLFVTSGFAEVSPERCTVLAEEVVRLADIDRGEAESRVLQAREALDAAADPAKPAAARRVAAAEALLAAVERAQA
jgi:F-type H+-transporting ATPase subunit epsilon